MIRKVIFICTGLLWITTTVLAQLPDTSAQKLTLQQCIAIALKNNSDIQHREVTSDIAKVTWQGAKGNMIPTLNGDISHGLSQGRSIDPFTNTYANQNIGFANYSLNSSVTLFNEFAIQNNIKQNRFAFDASKMEVQQMKDAIALNVILEYLQVLTNTDLMEASAAQRDVSGKQVERLEILNQEGAIPPSQLYDLKGQYANEELNVVNAGNSLETAKVLLAQLLNLPYNKNLEFEKVGLTDAVANNKNNSDSIYQAALQNLAIIKASELRKQSAVYGVKTYRSLRYPSLYLSGGLFTNYSSNATTQQFINSTEVSTDNYVLINGDKIPVVARQDNFSISKINYGSQFSNNFNTSISIGVRVPLSNNLQNRTQLRTAVLLQKDAEITLKTNKVQLQQNIEQAYVNMTAAQNRFDVLTDQVNAFAESFREAEIKFNAGAINSVDYLVAKNNLDRANINLIIARYDFVLRSMILDYYSGALTFQ
jgi:outer membrane protein